MQRRNKVKPTIAWTEEYYLTLGNGQAGDCSKQDT